MKRFGVAAALLVMAGTVQAQGGTVDAQCNAAATPLKDACQKAGDIFRYVAPQFGTSIAGGNTIMGQGGVLGGLPHWTVGVRATAVMGSLPEFTSSNAPATNGTTSTAYTTKSVPIPFPAVDAAVGVFGGVPLGVTKVGGVDVLASVAYIPSVDIESFSVAPKTNIKIGYGLKVGLLQESLVMPGVAFSVIRRGLPVTTITASMNGNKDTLQIQDLDLKTTSYRLTASKSLLLFGVAVGVGRDTYSSSTAVNVALNRTIATVPATNQRFATTTPFAFASDMSRMNYFADAYINLLILKIVGEVGMVSGGENLTYNTFDKLPDASRKFGALGIRIGF